MKNIVLFIVAIAFLAISCTTTRTTTSKRMDIYGSGVVQLPVVAELVVKETKVSGSARTASGQSVETVRNNAIANALKSANADVLIEPIFEVETNRGGTTVTVTGFPGNYVNFRDATPDDVPLLDMGILQKATVNEGQQKETRTPRSGLIAGLGGGALLLLLLATLL